MTSWSSTSRTGRSIREGGRCTRSGRYTARSYRVRPDVMAVCHNHARSLIPFGITGTAGQAGPARGRQHRSPRCPSGTSGTSSGDTDLLVTTPAARRLPGARVGPHRVSLMRGHGAVVAAHDLKATVFVSIYLMVNASSRQARPASSAPVTYLSEGEIRLTEQMNFRARSQNRAWEYWPAGRGSPPRSTTDPRPGPRRSRSRDDAPQELMRPSCRGCPFSFAIRAGSIVKSSGDHRRSSSSPVTGSSVSLAFCVSARNAGSFNVSWKACRRI